MIPHSLAHHVFLFLSFLNFVISELLLLYYSRLPTSANNTLLKIKLLVLDGLPLIFDLLMEVVDVLIKLDFECQVVNSKPMLVSLHAHGQFIKVAALKLNVIKETNHDLPAFLQSFIVLLIMLQLL